MLTRNIHKRLLPVNHYMHIPPFIDTLFLTAHLVH